MPEENIIFPNTLRRPAQIKRSSLGRRMTAIDYPTRRTNISMIRNDLATTDITKIKGKIDF